MAAAPRHSGSLLSEDNKQRLRRVSKEVTRQEFFLRRGFVVNFRRLMECLSSKHATETIEKS